MRVLKVVWIVFLLIFTFKSVATESPQKALSLDDKSQSEEILVSQNKKSESDIPLNLGLDSFKKTTNISSFQKMIMSIGLIFVISFFFFLFLGKMRQRKGYGSIAKNINILAQKNLGPKKNLMLIQVAGETLLLGVTDYNINLIKSLSILEDELPQFTPPKFSKNLEEKIKKDQEKSATFETQDEGLDPFQISKLNHLKKVINERFSLK